MEKEQTAYILVGLPASGKSTWVRRNRGKNTVVLSTDDFIEKKAEAENASYSEVFKKYIDDAHSELYRDLDRAINTRRDIIWDQTNLNRKKRNSILRKLPDSYKKVAVVFQVSDKELERRLKGREKAGKIIPKSIIDNMARSFQMPDKSEGFDEIVKV